MTLPLTFPTLPNNSATNPQESSLQSLLTFQPEIPQAALRDKGTYGKWRANPNTKHLVYSLTEGLNPALRASTIRGNAPSRLRGVVADYDILSKISDEERTKAVEALPEELRPMLSHRTFSGGIRLIWPFEKTIDLGACPELADAFLLEMGKRLALQKLAPGWDDAAWRDLTKFYDVGTDWQQHYDEPLEDCIVQQALFDAAQRVGGNVLAAGDIEIPFEVVAAECERRYPGRWTGEFREGARGCVFFDPDSKNPSAAILTSRGVVCFSQAKVFYTWKEIFGEPFVREYEQDRIGKAVAGMYYAGEKYWYRDGLGEWRGHKQENAALRLRVAGLSVENKKGVSEVSRALHFLHEHRYVDGVMPVVFNKAEVVRQGSRRYLNVARAVPMEPAPAGSVSEWGQGFPWLGEMLHNMLEGKDRIAFLAWWKVFYEGALSGTLSRGHAMILLGPVESGKSFISNVVVAGSVGGHCPAGAFVLGTTDFNREVFDYGLMTVDDQSGAASDAAASKFGERVKSIIVNPLLKYRAMYQDGVPLDWYGRLFLTGNDDQQSLRGVPPLDGSIDDKLMIVHSGRAGVPFEADYRMNTLRAVAELPFLLRWLLDWQIPAEMLGGRLGIKGYINDLMHAKATAAAGVMEILDLLNAFGRVNNVWADGAIWTGKAVDLVREMSGDDSFRGLALKDSTRTVGRKLSKLHAMGNEQIKIHRASVSSNTIIWEIHPPPTK